MNKKIVLIALLGLYSGFLFSLEEITTRAAKVSIDERVGRELSLLEKLPPELLHHISTFLLYDDRNSLACAFPLLIHHIRCLSNFRDGILITDTSRDTLEKKIRNWLKIFNPHKVSRIHIDMYRCGEKNLGDIPYEPSLIPLLLKEFPKLRELRCRFYFCHNKSSPVPLFIEKFYPDRESARFSGIVHGLLDLPRASHKSPYLTAIIDQDLRFMTSIQVAHQSRQCYLESKRISSMKPLL